MFSLRGSALQMQVSWEIFIHRRARLVLNPQIALQTVRLARAAIFAGLWHWRGEQFAREVHYVLSKHPDGVALD